MNNINKIEALDKNLERVQNWTVNCDTKASILLTVEIAFLALILSLDSVINALSDLSSVYGTKCAVASVILTLTFLFAIGSIVTHICVLFPRTNIPSGSLNESFINKSNIYFDTIADMSYTTFADNWKQINEESYENELVSQIYNCSIICKKKFQYFRKSIILTGLFFLSIIILGVLAVF